MKGLGSKVLDPSLIRVAIIPLESRSIKTFELNVPWFSHNIKKGETVSMESLSTLQGADGPRRRRYEPGKTRREELPSGLDSARKVGAFVEAPLLRV